MQRGFSLIIVLIGLVVLAGLIYGGYSYFEQQKIKSINTFEGCTKYYPVMESYPAQCNTPDGRHFVQQISEEEKQKLVLPKESSDSINLDENGWRTYTNKLEGYQLVYPEDYSLEEDLEGDIKLKNLKISEYPLIDINLVDKVTFLLINKDPREIKKVDSSDLSFEEFTTRLLLASCDASGVNIDSYCDKVNEMQKYRNNYNLDGYIVYLNLVHYRYKPDSVKPVLEKQEEKGPIVVFDTSKYSTKRALVLVSHAADYRGDMKTINEIMLKIAESINFYNK